MLKVPKGNFHKRNIADSLAGHLGGDLAPISFFPSDLLPTPFDCGEVALDVEVSLSKQFQSVL